MTELNILKWLHILAMVYWLGGEWGVFQTSYNVINRKLSLEERRRHMEIAYRIDILARTGIILLLPLGLHMGYIWGAQPLGGEWLGLFWVTSLAWLSLTWAAFIKRETPAGLKLTKADEAIRYVVIPILLVAGLTTLLGWKIIPLDDGSATVLASAPGQLWYAAKVSIYGGLLIIGLFLRYIMREWSELFLLLENGDDPAVESKLEQSIKVGRKLAYVYWFGIALTGFIGATKPF